MKQKLHTFDEKCYHFKPDNRLNISLEDPKSESKTTYRATNTERKLIFVLKVEECLMKDFDNEKKCDYLLLAFPNLQKIDGAVAFLIELKGQDLSTALKQIRNTHTFFKAKLLNFTVKTKIVISKCRIKGNLKSNPDYAYLAKAFGENGIEYKEYFNDNI